MNLYKITGLIVAFAMAASGCAARGGGGGGSREAEGGGKTFENAEGNQMRQDFYNYVNGSLLSQVEIPADSNSWSYFYKLSDEAYEGLNKILMEAVGKGEGEEKTPGEERIASLYMTAMDKKARDEAGLGPVGRYVENIRRSKTVEEYLQALADMGREIPAYSLFPLFGDADMSDSSHYAWYLSGPDLGLGKETLEDETQSDLWKQYQAYVAKLLTLGGEKEREAARAAAEIFTFQKDLASVSLPLSQSGNPSEVYNPYGKEKVEELFSGHGMPEKLESMGVDFRRPLIVMEPEAEEKIAGYLTEERLELLKNYSIFCLLNQMAPYLSTDIRDAALNFDQIRKGIREPKSEEKLASEVTQGLLPYHFGKLYTEHYFSSQSREDVRAMAEKILDAYRGKLAALDWMGDETKKAAGKKLDTMDLKIGYPDRWPDYLDRAEIAAPDEGGIFIGNVLNLMREENSHRRELYGGPVDRSLWEMTPQTVNAYYNPLANEIVFPAAILQPPFYNPDADEAENLGGIGMVIAHEITHAFDDHGAQYDENGNYNVWWSQNDYEQFRRRTRAVVRYYSGFEGIGGRYVDGEQTLGENIADLGAVSCVSGIVGDDREGLRKLFTSYARIWASKYTEESMILRLNTDVHSPAKVRVNAVLSATDAFYRAYPEVREGDGMYLPPGDRVKVW